MKKAASDKVTAAAVAGAQLVTPLAAVEHSRAPRARYDVECREGIPERMHEYVPLITRANKLRELAQRSFIGRVPLVGNIFTAHLLRQAEEVFQQAMQLTRVKWTESVYNVVTDVGANDLLDKYLAGSAYTAGWFCGLISSVSFTAVAAANTQKARSGKTSDTP